MKSLTKRNLALIVLSVVVALCSLTFAATVKPAKATEKPVLSFQVMEAASIRIGKSAEVETQSTSGLRFRAQMDYATASYVKANPTTVKLGFIITPKALFDKRAAAEDSSYGKDDYIKSISNYVGNDGEGIIVDVNKIYVADASDNITKWETTDDVAQEGETYCVNGAVEGILKKNINLGFTVIAYIYDGTDYTYSVPSADFERSYTQTATKAYLSGKNDLEVIQKAQHLSNFGISTSVGEEVVPLAITNGQDLYKISEGVSNGITYDGFKFELKENVEVDYDFEQIGATFGGEFVNNNNGKVVSIVNNKDLQDAFADAGVNVDCVNDTKVFNTTEKSLKLMTVGRQVGDTNRDRYLTNDKLPTVGKKVVTYDSDGDDVNDAKRLDDNVLYGADKMIKTGSDALAFSLSNVDSFRLKLNYTKEQLLAMAPVYNAETEKYENSSSPYGTYNHVRFTYALIRTNTGGCNPNESSLSSSGTSLFDVLTQEKFFGASGRASSAGEMEVNIWRSYMLSIEDFAKAVGSGSDAEDVLFIGYFSTMSGDGGTFELYISDIELVNDTSTILSIETNYSGAPIVTYSTSRTASPTYDKATGECITKGTFTLKLHEDNPTYCDPSTYPYAGFDNPSFKIQLRNLTNVYIKLRYTQEEIIKRAKAYGYNGISLTYLVEGSGYPPEGVMELNHKTGAWNTIKLSIEDFCEYFGAVSLKPSSNAAFEPIENYDIASSSAIKEVSKDLLQLRCSRTYLTVYLYIGQISFVNM